MVDHRIAWQVTQRIRLSDKTTRQQADADWPLEDEEAAKASIMSQMSQSMMCPLGGTMAQIAQWTSPSEISYKRWDDRTAPTRVNPNNVPPHPRLQLLGEGKVQNRSEQKHPTRAYYIFFSLHALIYRERRIIFHYSFVSPFLYSPDSMLLFKQSPPSCL